MSLTSVGTPSRVQIETLAGLIREGLVLSRLTLPRAALPLALLMPPAELSCADLANHVVFAVYEEDPIDEVSLSFGDLDLSFSQFRTCKVWPVSEFVQAMEVSLRQEAAGRRSLLGSASYTGRRVPK